MLKGKLKGTSPLRGSIGREVISSGGGDAPIKTISVDGVEVEPDSKKNVNIDLGGKVDRPSKSVVQQVVTIKPNDGDTEGIGLASASSDAIFGRIPRYQNPAYDNADAPPQNMGNLVVADPIKPLHVANKRWAENNFVKQQNLSDTDALPYYAYVRTKKTIDGETKEVDDKVGITQWGASPYSIAQRTNSGALIVGTPTNNNEATTKKYVDDNFVGKFDGSQETGDKRFTVYAQELGEQKVMPFSSSAKDFAIAQYTSGGNFVVAEPRNDTHATTKKYVDDKFVAKPTDTSGYNRVYGTDASNQTIMFNAQYPNYSYMEDGKGSRNGVPVISNGNIGCSAPIDDYHTTNKKYVDDKFNGANKAVSFVNYSAMINSLNALPNNSYNVGQNIMVITLQVPDLWVSEITETSIAYTYVSDDDFVNELTTNGSVQVGYYKLSALETQKVDLTEYAKLTQLDGKLDKITTPYGASVHRIYAIGTQGQQYVITTVDSNNVVETKKHSEETYVAQQKPEFDAGATRGYAYVIEQEKNAETGEFEQFQRVKKIQIQANADTIPLRNPNGNFYVGNATLPYEAVNKGYVDGLVGDIGTALENILGV